MRIELWKLWMNKRFTGWIVFMTWNQCKINQCQRQLNVHHIELHFRLCGLDASRGFWWDGKCHVLMPPLLWCRLCATLADLFDTVATDAQPKNLLYGIVSQKIPSNQSVLGYSDGVWWGKVALAQSGLCTFVLFLALQLSNQSHPPQMSPVHGHQDPHRGYDNTWKHVDIV